MAANTRNDRKTTAGDEPILDRGTRDQLHMELYGTGLVDDGDSASSLSSQTRIIHHVGGGSYDDNNNNSSLKGGVLVVGASILGLVGMQFPFLFIKHAPFMATPARKIRDALKFLGHNQRNTAAATTTTMPSSFSSSSASVSRLSPPAQLSPPVFVDLGSGDGQAVYEAARLGYKSVGIEFNWTLWAFSSLRRQFFWPSEVKR